MPWWKYVSNRFLTGVENLAFGLHLSEYHTGYRAFSREVLEAVNFRMNSDGFVFDQEIIAQAVAARFRIAEIAVPVRYFPEASSASFWASCGYGLKILWVVDALPAAPDRASSARAGCMTLRGRYQPPGPGRRAAAAQLIAVRVLDVGRPSLCGLAVASPRSSTGGGGPRSLSSCFWACSPSRLLVAPSPCPRSGPAGSSLVGHRRSTRLVFSFITVTRHLTFQTHALDLGYYVQLTWNLARGARRPRQPARDARVGRPPLADHVPLRAAFWRGPGPGGPARRPVGGAGAGRARRVRHRAPPARRRAARGGVRRALSAEPVAARHQRARLPRRRARDPAAPGRHLLRRGGPAVALRSGRARSRCACREDAALPVVGLGAWLALARRRWLWGA